MKLLLWMLLNAFHITGWGIREDGGLALVFEGQKVEPGMAVHYFGSGFTTEAQRRGGEPNNRDDFPAAKENQ